MAVDITGKRFGKLVAVNRSEEKTKSGAWKWNCVCDCGNNAIVGIGRLNTKHPTKSCGCLAKRSGKDSPHYKHGLSLDRNSEYKIYQREKYDMCKYNLSATKKTEIFSNQKGCCAICGYKFGRRKGDMCVDHDHKTGNVRGLLCDKCNRGLGYFMDKNELLRKAADYLSKQQGVDNGDNQWTSTK